MRKDSCFTRSAHYPETTREMRASQMCGCLSAVIRAVLINECLLMSVRGDGADSTGQPETTSRGAEGEANAPSHATTAANLAATDLKYVLIGGGIGLFLAAGFIIVMACLIRKYVFSSNTGPEVKRTSEPQMLALSNTNQSEPPVAAVSSDMQW